MYRCKYCGGSHLSQQCYRKGYKKLNIKLGC